MTSNGWTSICVRKPRQKDAVISALFSLGAEGIQELDEDVVTHIHDLDVARAHDVLRNASPWPIEYAETPSVDWSQEWRQRLIAHRVGKLVVTPPWLADEFQPAERVVIAPGMAFGTGDHETTRGMLRLMQDVVQPGDLVADLGAGSGVLAIGAAKLGAGRVLAIEVDPDAIGNAEENVAANDVGDRVSILEGDAVTLLPLVAPVQVIFANIISSVLITLLPVMRASLSGKGAAILSGILTADRDEMLRAIHAGGWRVANNDEEGLWWSVAIAPA